MSLDGRIHKKSVCALLAHRTMGRYLRRLKDGSIKIDPSGFRASHAPPKSIGTRPKNRHNVNACNN